jgi:cell division protein FtsL
MSVKESWKKLSTTEKVFLGAILILIIAVAANWEKISKEMVGGFDRYFGK